MTVTAPRKRTYLFAFLCGAVSALAFAPLSLFPLMFLGLAALAHFMRGTTTVKQAFLISFFFAWGQLIFGLYWIGFALLVDAEKFGWLFPFAILGLPFIIALFYGVAGAAWRKLPWQGIASAVALGLCWFIADMARSHLFSGLPWNITGYIWADILPVLQTASLIGIEGLGLLTAVGGTVLVIAFDKTLPRKTRLICGLVPVVLFGLLAVWGDMRVAQAPLQSVAGTRLRLVQPNIPQKLKWDPEARAKNTQTLLDLSNLPSGFPLTHIIWPETALPFAYATDDATRKKIAQALPADTVWLTGAIRMNQITPDERLFYNSLYAFDRNGTAREVYDKAHLVPFGEYVPFRSFAPVAAAAGGVGDFTAGKKPRTLRLDDLPAFSPLVCYEVIFSGAVTDDAERPAFLLNITNDAWYGRTSGPYQHFAMARVRAVEEGLPMVRVANTGVSGVVDAVGRVQHRLDLDLQGIIDADLPTSLPPTLFATYRRMPLLALVLALWAACYALHRRRCKPGN